MTKVKNDWREIGEALQYPKCCIDYFDNGGAGNPGNITWGGFIPCKEHQKLSLDEIINLIGRNPLHDIDLEIEGNCSDCNKIFNIRELEKTFDGKLLCPECNPNNFCCECKKCLGEEWHRYKDYFICIPCLEKKIENELENVEIFVECLNERTEFFSVFSIEEITKSADNKITIRFECLECNFEHTSQIFKNK